MIHRLAILLLSVVALCACDRFNIKSEPSVLYETITISRQTYVYDKAVLRAQRLETLKEGERLQVLLEPKNRWLQVRTPSGMIGWIESRDALRQEYFQEWQQLSKQIEGKTPQTKGDTAEEAYLRLRPGRDTIKVHKLSGSKKVEIFAVAHTEKPPKPGEKPVGEKAGKSNVKAVDKGKPARPGGKKSGDGPKYDTWYLVRTTDGLVGWLFSGLVTLSIPDELNRYAETKTIIAYHILTVSKDENGQEHPWYLSIEREDGSNQDFDRVRILYWNTKRGRYELAYRIQNIIGVFPVESKRVDPGQSGLPSFKIRRLNQDNLNQIIVDEYQVNGAQTKLVSSTPEGV